MGGAYLYRSLLATTLTSRTLIQENVSEREGRRAAVLILTLKVGILLLSPAALDWQTGSASSPNLQPFEVSRQFPWLQLSMDLTIQGRHARPHRYKLHFPQTSSLDKILS